MIFFCMSHVAAGITVGLETLRGLAQLFYIMKSKLKRNQSFSLNWRMAKLSP